MKDKHEHVFKPTTQQVLLRKYRVEDGRMRYVTTTGKDTLKYWLCKCGAVETYDLKRLLV